MIVTKVQPELHTLVVRVENKAGVLARIAGLFSRRGFNIESLAVAPTDDDRFSRITIVVDVTEATSDQVVKQLDKLVNVVEIRELDSETSVERELMMATLLATSPESRREIIDLVQIFDAQVLNVGFDSLMVSLAGSQRRLDDFEALLGRYGIIEIQRTGKIALSELAKVEPTTQTDKEIRTEN
jgi:acetolactate synthase-1/3 small subunit